MRKLSYSSLIATVLIAVGCTGLVTNPPSTQAQSWVNRSLIRGPITFYIGTADTATTFSTADSYSTNRTYTFGGSTYTPKATNQVTGTLDPNFQLSVPVIAARDGKVSDNLALNLEYTRGTGTPTYTNTTTTLTFNRSADGGTTYDVSTAGSFVVSVDAVAGSCTITNLPSTFLAGTSHIRLQKVVTGANPPDAGVFQLTQVNLSGYQP